MSYALRIAPDVYADLREMEPWLQEEALDAIERAALAPTALRIDGADHAVLDFDKTIGGQLHVVFIRLHVDRRRCVVSVIGIEDVRPKPRL